MSLMSRVVVLVALLVGLLGAPPARSAPTEAGASAAAPGRQVVLRAPDHARSGTTVRVRVRVPASGPRKRTVRLRVMTANGVTVLRARSGRARTARFDVPLTAPGVVRLRARVAKHGHRPAVRSRVRLLRVWPAATPQLLAHRGRNAVAPENTMPAFSAALGHASGVETDLRMTSDGRLVLMHDPTLRRTTDVRQVFPTRADQPVETFTRAELRQLDAGRWFGPAWAGTRIPDLDDLLHLVATTTLSAHIELKSSTPEFVDRLVAALQPYLPLVAAGRIRFNSVDLTGLDRLRTALPAARLALIRADPPADLAALAGRVDAVHVLAPYVDGALVARARAAGLGIVARSANDPAAWAALAAAGPYAVMTDDLDGAAEVLGPPPAA
ncbi:glycerophosphodiester phosphodiesterase [Nocardioides nitrophenolicus]|uniref:glycerophosphodiester phosphodiesterase n=1 Tax=Nocardioides nitrophenolicus TaxID=60489 RepID=UPI0019585E7E|nr:glycerophosphodiester phosphodiesterase family protein [Nocardioides nitrophenolicus]MBM7518057.1 glycerophosphoryl diester phosphodiesterase [Nocardioides nitrophenolicus]